MLCIFWQVIVMHSGDSDGDIVEWVLGYLTMVVVLRF